MPTLAVEHYVSAPMVLFVIFKALMGKVMRDVICPYNALSRYMLQIAYGNFLASFACIVGWVVWMLSFDTQWNNSEMFSIYHERLDCNRATDSLEVGRCQAAYLLWGSPLIIGRVGTFHHVSLQSKHQLMTASMVHVTNLTPGSDNPSRGRHTQRRRVLRHAVPPVAVLFTHTSPRRADEVSDVSTHADRVGGTLLCTSC